MAREHSENEVKVVHRIRAVLSRTALKTVLNSSAKSTYKPGKIDTFSILS